MHQRAQLPDETILARNYQARTAVELTTVPEVEVLSVALQLVGKLQSLRRETLLLREEERLQSLRKN